MRRAIKNVAITTLAVGVSTAGTLFGGEGDSGKPLRVGITPELPPMVFKQGRAFAGVEIDLANALGRNLGRPIEFVAVKWKDQIPALLEGKTDIIMSSMSITRARSALITFSNPYLRIGQMALVRRADQYRYALGFPSVLPGPVGVKEGTTGDFFVQTQYPKAERKTYADGEKAAKALIKKRIDLFVSDAPLVWWLAGAHEKDDLTAIPMLLSTENLGWGLRKSDVELLEAVNAFLEERKATGELTAIVQRWLPSAR